MHNNRMLFVHVVCVSVQQAALRLRMLSPSVNELHTHLVFTQPQAVKQTELLQN